MVAWVNDGGPECLLSHPAACGLVHLVATSGIHFYGGITACRQAVVLRFRLMCVISTRAETGPELGLSVRRGLLHAPVSGDPEHRTEHRTTNRGILLCLSGNSPMRRGRAPPFRCTAQAEGFMNGTPSAIGYDRRKELRHGIVSHPIPRCDMAFMP